MPNEEFVDRFPCLTPNPKEGGCLVNQFEKDNAIYWETITSQEETTYALVQEGFRAIFHKLGIGVKYDEDGDLSAIRVEVLPLLHALLDQVDDDDDSCDEIFGMAVAMEEDGNKFVAHIDLLERKYHLFVFDKVDQSTVLAKDKEVNFGEPVSLVVKTREYTLCLFFQEFENDFTIGVGFAEEQEADDEPSIIGDLPGVMKSDGGNQYRYCVLNEFISNDCNYLTYLDSKSPDRFDRLAKRIILEPTS